MNNEIRYERCSDSECDDTCHECDATPAFYYEDARTGDEIILCESCADDDYPRCPCGARGEIPISNSNGLVVCRACADAEEENA